MRKLNYLIPITIITTAPRILVIKSIVIEPIVKSAIYFLPPTFIPINEAPGCSSRPLSFLDSVY